MWTLQRGTIWLITLYTLVIHSPNSCDCLSVYNSSQDAINSDGISRDTGFKDYRDWSLVRVYPRTAHMLKAFLDDVGSNVNANVLSVKRIRSKYEVDVALGPSVTLAKLLTSKTIPELCCLDEYVKKHENKRQKSRPEGEVVAEVLQNHAFNLSDCSLSDRSDGSDRKGEEKRIYRSRYMMEWATVFRDFGKFFTTGTPRQMATTGDLTWDSYYRHDSIMQFAKNLANSSLNVGYIPTGFSHEGRELFALAFATNIPSILRRYIRKSPAVDSLLARGGPQLQQMRSRANVKTIKSLRQKRSKRSKIKIKPEKQMNSVDGEERKKKGNNKGYVEEREKVKKEKKKKDRVRRKTTKPIVLIEAGTHAREWISPAVATYMAQQLSLSGNSFLQHVTVLIVPVANPDGYEYTHVWDRMWRKNRRTFDNMDGCVGVDLNRNWNISWGDEDGASTDPCSFQYCGDRAFSEAETSAIRNLTAVYLDRLQVFISLHSYGQFLLHPWGHTVKKPPKSRKLRTMGKRLLLALNNNGNTRYTAGQSSWILYQSSGTADDYMYSLGVPYTYTVELPGTTSFELPADQILPTAEDFWSSFVCFLGDVIGTTKAKSFCSKKIVTVTTENNVTMSTWVDKVVPTETAKAMLLTKVRRKNRNSG